MKAFLEKQTVDELWKMHRYHVAHLKYIPANDTICGTLITRRIALIEEVLLSRVPGRHSFELFSILFKTNITTTI